ncbi:unnamed protein product [Sphagnum jensenii]|jgi:hypothetical protein|uniref:Aldo/keto reductase n=1 Tax=Sphagnum jensenii TaxID=128206 RepID=A0ABP0WFA0_9BRYO
MHKGKDVVPILGTTEKGNLKSNIQSVAVTLTEEEIEEVEAAVPAAEVAGERYHERSMKLTRHHVVSPPFSSWKGSQVLQKSKKITGVNAKLGFSVSSKRESLNAG